MKSIRFALAILCGLILAVPAAAKGDDPLFASSDVIQLTIKAPLSTLIRNRNISTPIAGVMIDSAGQALPITLRLRGITRRSAEICDFPPLRVDFIAPPPATSIFAGQKHLKLVDQCRNSAAYQQYVLLEYAAYRMYNLLTPRSFKVRLASINFQGDDGRMIAQRQSFFIEDLKDVAKRNNSVETHAPPRIGLAELNPSDAGRYAMFQHMIANHDWSMSAGPQGEECCHNARLIGPRGAASVSVIPYDFDYSGFVNAPYATPPDQLKINDVKQRFYRGYCSQNAAALAAAQQIRAAEPQLLAALSQTPGLDPKAAQRAANYLGSFFADIATDQAIGGKILNRCLGG